MQVSFSDLLLDGGELENFFHCFSSTPSTLLVIILGEQRDVLLRDWVVIDVGELIMQCLELLLHVFTLHFVCLATFLLLFHAGLDALHVIAVEALLNHSVKRRINRIHTEDVAARSEDADSRLSSEGGKFCHGDCSCRCS